MSKNDSEFQVKIMSRMFREKQIFKPLNIGYIDEKVACIREYVANVFFYIIVISQFSRYRYVQFSQ